MDNIAYEIGNFIIKAFDYAGMEIVGDIFRWSGVMGAGYGVIFIIIIIIFLFYIIKK
jgi:hypothetical protein